jgi:hypothetical protein
MAHIIKWEQIVLMGHVGHMVHMAHMGHVGHVALLVHMVRVGHVLRLWMKNVGHLLQMLRVGHVLRLQMRKCGTFVADVTCETYVTHVPYLQMVLISMDLPNEYKHVFTSGSKTKIRFTPNDQDFC